MPQLEAQHMEINIYSSAYPLAGARPLSKSEKPGKLLRQIVGVVLHLLEFRNPTRFGFDVLYQSRDQFVCSFASWTLEFIRIVCRRIEVHVQSSQDAECAVTNVAFVSCSVECSLAS